MLDGGFSDLQILDSSRYRALYIAKVYEVGPKKVVTNSAMQMSNDGDPQTMQFDRLKID